MEELRVSRHARRPRKAAAKTTYDDVSGRPPRFAVPFARVPDDYSEIFGGVTASCSIPFLDLPAAAGGGGGLDYREIFACYSFGDFAVPCEELFGDPASEESPPSRYGRVSSKEKSNQKNIESPALDQEYSSEDQLPYFGEDQFSSTSFASDEVVEQVKVSYNKTNQGRMEDPLVQTTTGVTYKVDSCNPLPNTQANGSSKTANGGRIQEERRKVPLPGSSSDSPKSSRRDFATPDRKLHDTTCLPLVNGRADVNLHSISSEEAVSPISFLSISAISLQTRPLQVPPPSRPPPKLQNKQELSAAKKDANLMKNVSTSAKYDWAFPKSNAHCFFDVEVDASSAAATSAAAMKEAMELAQARLKSAKESLERKRKGVQNQKKQGHHESPKNVSHHESQKSVKIEGNPVLEEEIFKTMLFQKKTVKDENIDDLSFLGNDKFTFSGKSASCYGKEEAQSADWSGDTMQKRGPESSEASYNFEKSGEWKSDDEFYKLTNNKPKYRNTAGAADQEDVAKRTNPTRNIVNEAENPTASLSAEVGKIEKPDDNGRKELEAKYLNLIRVSATTTEDSIEDGTPIILEGLPREENIIKQEVWDSKSEEYAPLENLQESHYDGKKVNEIDVPEKAPSSLVNEMHDTMPKTYVHECNANKLDGNNSCHSDENSVSEATQETSKSNGTDGLNILYETEKSFASEGSEKVLEAQESCKFDKIHGSQGRECYIEVAEEACESEQAPLPGNGVGAQNENEKVVTVHDESSLVNPGENLESEAAEWSEALKEKGIQENVECPQEENGVKLESSLGHEHEKVEEPNVSEDASIWTESKSEVQPTPNSDEVEDMDKQQRAQGLEELVELHNVTAFEYVRKETGSQPEYVQNSKKCDSIDSTKQDSYDKHTVNRVDDRKGACDVPTKGNATPGFRGDDIRTNADTNIFSTGVCTGLNDQQAAGMEKNAILPSLAKDAASVSTEGIRKGADISFCRMGSNTDTERERERARQTAREREQEKERLRRSEEERQWDREIEKEGEEEEARILEEEKVRRREREKDRLAVERDTREARERAPAEAGERVERIAMERITASRQRAFAESREKEGKSFGEVFEKQTSEKTSREARQHAAVERATAEARERAIERAKAEKAAADAKERMDRLKSSFKEGSKVNSQEVAHDAQAQRTTGSAETYADPGKQGEGESALRHKARLERHQRTAERAAKALAEKNMQDMLAQREQAERNRLAEYLDVEVKRWSNGKEGNLRALLSTLQYILGLECGWQPIPLTDVITAASVKKAYRKAMLCVHPDKLQQRAASIQHKYICEKVFDLLKEAWNRYNSEER